MSLKILEGDEGIRELLRDYKGVENEGAGTEAVEGEEVGDVTGVFWGDYVDWGEVQGEFQTEVQTRVEGDVGTGVENEVQNDESESNSNSSLVSDCPSWMLEDLEGPWDDDIFTNRPENYTRTMLKTLRSLMRERRKKRKQEQQNKKGEGSSRGNEQWFSDCEDEELKSVRGSDDEGDGCPVWDERMNMGKVDLAVGMKFETRAKFRDVMRDWAVRRGWDLKLVKNEKHLILATCKNECNWKGYSKAIASCYWRDPNDNIYPIAVAYVEVEKYDSWEWFLNLLLRDIGSHNERGWAFISDRQKGLLEAIAELAPGLNTDSVLRHIIRTNTDKHPAPHMVPPVFSQPSQDSQPQVPVQPPLQPYVPAHDPPPQTAPRNPFKAVHSKKTTQQPVQQQHPQSSGVHQ
ncbi:UNVERIFIED_CONTAM: hypothetical protein Scaly_2994100 [Sesamum calycinum]|uniref:Transposase MuDR plant domain-containing protein n=1 Tax=Sesamum calycinum TaxID=2727403 RepID=A0AAW2KGU9_9LAMI